MRKTYVVLWHDYAGRLCRLSFTVARKADSYALRMRRLQGIMAWVETT